MRKNRTDATRQGNGLVRFLKNPFHFAMVYGAVLGLFSAFVLLDAFVIPRAQASVVAAAQPPAPSAEAAAEEEKEEAADVAAPSEASITATSYQDEHMQITVETIRRYDTTLYVADIRLSDASLLKTALAKNVFGRNIKDTTSNIAEEHAAIFAINGDYYGFRDAGWVLRNGTWYRETSNGGDALVVDAAGNFSIVGEDSVSAASLGEAWQVFSFGPALINDGEIAVSVNEEINGKSTNSNPRTAIGQAGALHYLMIVSDGRTSGEAGLSLYQLAQVFQAYGCTVAYNLDGGGSSTMVLNGEVVNAPIGGGGRRSSGGSERAVSDIVYIGYE